MIYESLCHNLKFEENKLRNLQQHFYSQCLLLLPACRSGRWGPPGCTGVCDTCYNGGICDDLTGRCVCSPGFMGLDCLTGLSFTST